MIRSKSDKKDTSLSKPSVGERSRRRQSPARKASGFAVKSNSAVERAAMRPAVGENGRNRTDKSSEGRKQEAIARHLALAERSPASSLATHQAAGGAAKRLEWDALESSGWTATDVRNSQRREIVDLTARDSRNDENMRQSYVQEIVVPSSLDTRISSGEDNQQARVSFTDSNSLREAAFEQWAAKKRATATTSRPKPQAHHQSEGQSRNSKDLDATFSRDDARQVTVVRENAAADSSTMRKMIYDQWLSEKEEREKQRRNEKLEKEKQEKEKLARAIREKKMDSQKAFESWKEKKTELLKEKLKDGKKMAKQNEEEKKEEEQTRLHESKVSFRSWKEKKDDGLKGKHLDALKEKTEEKKLSETEARKKREESKKAYDKWCALKEDKLTEEQKRIYAIKRQEEEENRRAIEERKEKSSTAFEAWRNRKESTDVRTRSRPPSPDVRIPWSPAGIGRGGVLRSQASTLYPKSPSPKPHSPSRTRKRKTIQVCCQTLEYWCVCDDGD